MYATPDEWRWFPRRLGMFIHWGRIVASGGEQPPFREHLDQRLCGDGP